MSGGLAHAADVSLVRRRKTLQAMGTQHLRKKLAVILGEADSDSDGAAVHELQDAAASFARRAGFLHDEPRLDEFLSLISAISTHAAGQARGSTSPATVSKDNNRDVGSVSQTNGDGTDECEGSDEDAVAHEAAGATTTRRQVPSQPSTPMVVDTTRSRARSREQHPSPVLYSPSAAVLPATASQGHRASTCPKRLHVSLRRFCQAMSAKDRSLRGEFLVSAVLRRLLADHHLLADLKERFRRLRHEDVAFGERVEWILDSVPSGAQVWVAGIARLRDIFWGSFARYVIPCNIDTRRLFACQHPCSYPRHVAVSVVTFVPSCFARLLVGRFLGG